MRQEDFEQASYYLTSGGAWPVDELRRLRNLPDLRPNNESFLSAFGDVNSRPGPLAQERMALLLTYLPDNNLARMDRASMASSVEGRAPFLHPALSDFSARLPLDMQIRGSALKYILRQALAGSIPPAIVQRPKQGFNAIPMADWMRNEFGSLIKDLLDPSELRRQGIFDAQLVAQTLDEHRRGGRFNHWWKLWLLLVLQMWLRHHDRLTRQMAPRAGVLASLERDSQSLGGTGVGRLQNEL